MTLHELITKEYLESLRRDIARASQIYEYYKDLYKKQCKHLECIIIQDVGGGSPYYICDHCGTENGATPFPNAKITKDYQYVWEYWADQ